VLARRAVKVLGRVCERNDSHVPERRQRSNPSEPTHKGPADRPGRSAHRS
jgi:hypothetical protein